MNPSLSALGLAILSLLIVQCPVVGQEPDLNTAGAPYAPLEINRNGQDPNVPLSKTQRNELFGQFRGLVYLGLHKVSFEEWQGKEMGDCDKSQNPADHWKYRCQIMVGQGEAYYYFYPNETRQAATLQELDVRVFASDERLLEDCRDPVQQLFGKATFVAVPSVRAKPSSRIRQWNTGQDVAELFIDRSVRPEGSVRFVWLRSPLVSNAHASLPQQTPTPE